MEDEILNLLQENAGTPFSVKEVSKRIDRTQYREDPHWARPFLEDLVRMRKIISDAHGFYFQAPELDDGATRFLLRPAAAN